MKAARMKVKVTISGWYTPAGGDEQPPGAVLDLDPAEAQRLVDNRLATYVADFAALAETVESGDGPAEPVGAEEPDPAKPKRRGAS